MTSEENTLLVRRVPEQPEGSTRRTFLHRAAIAGAIGVGSLLPLALPDAKASSLLGRDDHDDDGDDLKRRDHNIPDRCRNSRSPRCHYLHQHH